MAGIWDKTEIEIKVIKLSTKIAKYKKITCKSNNNQLLINTDWQ